VTGGHILVESVDGVGAGHLTVLLVHVVGAGAGVVTDPDTEVLDDLGALLVDLGTLLDKSRETVGLESADPRISLRTSFSETISPFAFLIFLSLPRKYQNLDLATTSLGAKMRMRYSLGAGLLSVGRWRPMTWYSWRRPGGSVSIQQELSASPSPAIAVLHGPRIFCRNCVSPRDRIFDFSEVRNRTQSPSPSGRIRNPPQFTRSPEFEVFAREGVFVIRSRSTCRYSM
jgi:hypothetical protein